MKKYIIDRTTWLRGEGASCSSLLRPFDGKMCCLGQCALQDGYTKEQIKNINTPRVLRYTKFLNNDGLHTPIAVLMMYTNDDETISNQEREAELIRLAKTLDMEWEFIN